MRGGCCAAAQAQEHRKGQHDEESSLRDINFPVCVGGGGYMSRTTAAFAVACLLGAGGATQLTAAPEDPILPIYVDSDNGDDTNDGKTKDKAMKTIEAAVLKADLAEYYNERRVCVTLLKGTHELSTHLYLMRGANPARRRTSLVGDPDCDRSEVVLTRPAGSAAASGFITMAEEPDQDYVVTIANLTVSNVNMASGTPINCGSAEHDRWSKVVSNVVFTLCTQSAGTGNFGVNADGRTLVTDCLFLANANTGNNQLATCLNGGWFRNCRIESCTNAAISASTPYSPYNIVENCVFTNNYSSKEYTCINNVPTVRDCVFVDNVSGGASTKTGGWGNNAFFADNPPVVANCTFAGNVQEKSGMGGGVLSFAYGGTVTNCTFTGNVNNASAVLNPHEVIDCTFTSNSCLSSSSGALRLSSGGNVAYSSQAPRVSGCTFVGNSTTWNAGAVYAEVPAAVDGCAFEGNSAVFCGGGICAKATVAVSNCTFSGNSAANGGGIGFIDSVAIADTLVADCVFTNNVVSASGNATGGAGIFASLNNNAAEVGLTVRNCLFVGNALTNAVNSRADGSAAFLFSQGASGTARIYVESCTMVENRGAYGSPSALYVGAGASGAPTYVTNTVIACNRGADGSYAKPMSPSATVATWIGHSYLHPKTATSHWTDEQHVADTDDLPAFTPGTWIPTKTSALCNAGVFQDWMDGAFDLQRNEKGRAFATRVYGGTPDIGAFERFPTAGFTVIVR